MSACLLADKAMASTHIKGGTALPERNLGVEAPVRERAIVPSMKSRTGRAGLVAGVGQDYVTIVPAL